MVTYICPLHRFCLLLLLLTMFLSDGLQAGTHQRRVGIGICRQGCIIHGGGSRGRRDWCGVDKILSWVVQLSVCLVVTEY